MPLTSRETFSVEMHHQKRHISTAHNHHQLLQRHIKKTISSNDCKIMFILNLCNPRVAGDLAQIITINHD